MASAKEVTKTILCAVAILASIAILAVAVVYISLIVIIRALELGII